MQKILCNWNIKFCWRKDQVVLSCEQTLNRMINFDKVTELLIFLVFFNCYLTVRWPSFGHSQGDSFTNPMLITAFVQVWPKGHREPRNEVGSLSSTDRLLGFEPGTFRFWLEHLNPLGYCPKECSPILHIQARKFGNGTWKKLAQIDFRKYCAK